MSFFFFFLSFRRLLKPIAELRPPSSYSVLLRWVIELGRAGVELYRGGEETTDITFYLRTSPGRSKVRGVREGKERGESGSISTGRTLFATARREKRGEEKEVVSAI